MVGARRGNVLGLIGTGDIRVAVVTKGHPFDAPAFFAVFDSIEGIRWTHVEHPEALELVEPERAAEFDVFVMYDMPGITFTRSDPPAEFASPPPGYADAFRQLLDAGKGMVFLHHAIAGWPAWAEYAEIVGGRFHYQPAELAGVSYPDSGYRHDVRHVVEVLDPAHPICAGLEASFGLTDELYLFPVLEDRVHPIMRSTYDFVDTNFYSADRAIRGIATTAAAGTIHRAAISWPGPRPRGRRRSPTCSSAMGRPRTRTSTTDASWPTPSAGQPTRRTPSDPVPVVVRQESPRRPRCDPPAGRGSVRARR